MLIKEIKPNFKESVKRFILDWDMRYPIDFWWRKRCGITFGSKLHREANFFDMALEFVEFELLNPKNDLPKEFDEQIKINKEIVDDAFANPEEFLKQFND
jgi:hypothetical protein